MARSLEFIFDGKSFSSEIQKVDRNKLYGSVEIETTDRDGRKCSVATLASDGKTLVPSGGTAFGYLNNDGNWVDRSDLIPVDKNNNRLNSVPSSFKDPIELELKVSKERFLDHSVRLCYLLDAEDMPQSFVKDLAEGAIFKTTFSYRGGIDPDPAFVMQGADESVWLLIGNENNIDFVSFEQTASAAEEDVDDAEDDDLDFGML